jgi:NitT/TauT family transport system substrate-binding protein
LVKSKLFVLSVALSLIGAACGGSDGESSGGGEGQLTVRLGYFPNITHATPIVGLEKGILAKSLGPDVKLETQTFNAGGQAIEAIFAEGLDATFIGPNPAINAFAKSNGEAIRILAGATSGGAYFVVKPEINSAGDLKGKKLATPQVGNTQDVALRSWLGEQGLKVKQGEKPDVEIIAQENAQTLETFRSGAVDGAWVPEPWASRLVKEAGGKVLVDEKDLWPDGKYVTTHLIVRTKFLEEHPEVVEALVRGHVEANDFVNSNSDEAKSTTGAAIEKITGRGLPKEVIDAAWENLTFTIDPIASSLKKSAEDAAKLGFIEKVDLNGIYDVSHLNKVLEQNGKSAIKV